MMENAEIKLQQFTAIVQAKHRRLSGDEIGSWVGTLDEVRRMADYHERNLIRYLKYDLRLRWQDIADILGLASKQAAQQRWRRLAPDNSREIRRGRGDEPMS